MFDEDEVIYYQHKCGAYAWGPTTATLLISKGPGAARMFSGFGEDLESFGALDVTAAELKPVNEMCVA